MDMIETWLRVFKGVVDREIKTAGGKAADGYRAVATRTGLGYDYVYQIYTGKPAGRPKRPSADAMSTLARVYLESDDEVIAGLIRSLNAAPLAPPIIAAAPGEDDTGTINVSFAKGSCGGGAYATDHGDEVREQLVKEASWFKKYGVKPEQTLAIYADGDSMAEFIVDGDIVIFKKGVRDLVSGKIYAIDTPDGLRIKRVHKRSDGTVILSSDNMNKARYPDEEYSAEQVANLQFKGSFIYRQGG